MNYNYYQQTAPGWGTNQLQFGQPPAPSFQPQPNWGGQDFYNAHAINPDASLYDNAWNRVRSYSGSNVEQGVGLHEAKHWHRRAYGGLGEVTQMPPEEIGHAAAYEAYRTWIHNSSMYEPLSGDIERQREGLIGLAVAEASRLLQFSNRSMDQYSRTAASESAAATASIIFYQSREREEGEYHRSRSRSRSRHRGSFSGGSYEEDEDPYASDYRGASNHFPRHRSRSHSRHRSHSFSRPSPLMQYQGLDTYQGLETPMPGSIPMSNAGPMSIPNVAQSGYAGSYGGGAPQYGVPMQPSSYQGQSYSAVPGMPLGVSQPYGSMSAMGVPMGRQRSTSMSMPYGQTPFLPAQYQQAQYPQVQYMQGAQGQYTMPRMGQQPTTIIIGGSGHRKHHRSKKSKRSRSSEPRIYTAKY
ncbi:hypothetical protein R3P38DRAFT_2840776 [Favolaschia claudopus]|uniref:Uncharacterized protein n=1 Tax=Favolaschia claudopus TaxID=2862362 RepID=A0AAW0E1P4_9AGAR